jgi:hypothetical protein
VGFVVGDVELGQVFLAVLLFYPGSIIRTTSYARYFICRRHCIILTFDSIVKQALTILSSLYCREADAMCTAVRHTEQLVVKDGVCYSRQVLGS